MCNKEVETVEHLFFQCDLAQAIWFASSFGLRLQGNTEINLQTLVQSWIQRNDNFYYVSLGMAICWAIWKIRNEKVFEDKQNTVHGALKIALFWFNLYYNPHAENESEAEENHLQIQPEAPQIWKTPDDPFIKLNVDAAWENGSYACAVVARDHNGVCWGAGTRIGRAYTPLCAEADGFLLATELATWLNFKDIVIEGDCQRSSAYATA
ncbi:uncharacterized protein LOC113359541 [Papaver somniferum]|uniref:uncharacterized protein LOC113359541 n=1 Tax=Papaver somniferum TaxID=3469 RepID=UPI000E6F4A1F|nr:uncharacterized protein LOC113359541 [Papaver somniferum]